VAARKGNRRKNRVAFLVDGKVTWGNDGFSIKPAATKTRAKRAVKKR
jgi:hypothetical protein